MYIPSRIHVYHPQNKYPIDQLSTPIVRWSCTYCVYECDFILTSSAETVHSGIKMFIGATQMHTWSTYG